MEKNGFVAPDMNKKGSPSVAEMGGTAIFFGFFAAAVLAIFLHSFFGWIPLDLTLLFAGFMTILLIAFIGIFDDIIGWKKGIRQYQHALFPIFAALPLMAVKAGTTVISVPLFGPVDFGLAYALVLRLFEKMFERVFGECAVYRRGRKMHQTAHVFIIQSEFKNRL
jgi:UDP-N-acetylglucosamine--dolichyl-phosphate N-acetylglucosaminephosphotransferase